jgi:hypothetical protein
LKIDKRIIARLEEMIAFGDKVLATKRQSTYGDIAFTASVDTEMANQWTTQGQNILLRVFGETSPHYKNFAQESKHLTYIIARRMQGVLRAALDDYRNDYLFDVKRLITGDVFSDILEQSRHLLETGYFQAAMVLAGSVLEDTLRSLCTKNGIVLSAKPKLDQMNSELAKAGEYPKLIQKRITAIADVRNSAAHGNWSDFKQSDVEDALVWIERFVEDQYA